MTANEPEEDEEPGELLLSLDYRPFAAPALAARIAGELTPQDTLTYHLLHLEGKIGWPAWFDLKERATRETWLTAGPTFSDARSLLLAAGQGLGIALAPVKSPIRGPGSPTTLCFLALAGNTGKLAEGAGRIWMVAEEGVETPSRRL